MDNAPTLRRGRSVAERNAERAGKAFNASPDGKRHNDQEGKIQKQSGDIAVLKSRLAKVEGWQDTFEAKTPLEMSGNTIALNARAATNVRGANDGSGGGGGSAGPTLKFFGVQNGAYAAWMIPAIAVTP